MLYLASTASVCVSPATNAVAAQTVPPSGLSITAISGAMPAERKIPSPQNVASIVLDLAFAPSPNDTPILTLRGIGFNESWLQNNRDFVLIRRGQISR